MRRFFTRLLKIEPGVSLAQWIYDTAAANWGKLASLFFLGGGMSYVTHLTETLKEYAPMSWALAGLFGILVGSVINLVFAAGSKWRADAEYSRAVTIRGVSTNPLKSQFADEKINIGDFYSRAQKPYKDKTFTNCEIVGPGSIAIFGGVNLINPDIIYCDIIPVQKGILNSRAAFYDCTFTNCRFVNVTMFMPAGDAKPFYELPGIDPNLAPVFGFIEQQEE